MPSACWNRTNTPPLPRPFPSLHAYLDTKEDEEEAKGEEGGGVVVVMVLKEEEEAAAPTAAAREARVAAPAAETTRGKRLLAAVRGKGIAVVVLWLCVWGGVERFSTLFWYISQQQWKRAVRAGNHPPPPSSRVGRHRSTTTARPRPPHAQVGKPRLVLLPVVR